MGILCVFCVYDTIGNRCFEKTSFPKIDKINAHVDVSSLDTGHIVGLSLPVHPYFVFQTWKALMSLHFWAGSCEPLLLDQNLIQWPICMGESSKFQKS